MAVSLVVAVVGTAVTSYATAVAGYIGAGALVATAI